MNTNTDEQLKRKSKRALWFGIVFAFVFAITWGFPSGFAFTTFAISAYCFFLAVYWQPRAPNPSAFNKPFGQQGAGKTIKIEDADIVKRVVRIIAFGIFGLFAILMIVGIFAGDDEQSETVNYTEEESTEADAPTDESSIASPDWLTIGNNFYEQTKYDSAEYYYDRVLAEDPQNSAAVYNKGLTRYERQDFETALNLFQQSYDLGMRTAFLCTELAQKYAGQGNTAQAVVLYKEAVGQDSTLVNVYARLAELDATNATTYRALEQKYSSGSN